MSHKACKVQCFVQDSVCVRRAPQHAYVGDSTCFHSSVSLYSSSVFEASLAAIAKGTPLHLAVKVVNSLFALN